MELSCTFNLHVVRRFDCGGGPIVIHSVAAVSLHQWHNVTAWREGHRGSMVLDGGAVVSGDSQVGSSAARIELWLMFVNCAMLLRTVLPLYMGHAVSYTFGL